MHSISSTVPRLVALVALVTATGLGGCSVFRKTAVDEHVAMSRELTLQGLAANYDKNEQHAKSLFTSAVDSDPENVEARMLLAQTYRKRGHLDAAIKHLEECVRIDPENIEVICQLGDCYAASNHSEYAYQLAQLVLRKDHQSVPGWSLKARTSWQLGEKEQALADYQRALRIDPNNHQLRKQMVALYQELGKPLRALTTLDKIANEFDNEKIPEEILLLQSSALQQLNRNPEAIDRLKTAYQRGDYSEELAEAYVAALIKENQLEKAQEAFRAAGTRYPQGQRLAQLQTRLHGLKSPSSSQTQTASFR